MEKIYSLLWILFAIGVFVFRMVKKMQETSDKEKAERPRPLAEGPALPQVTFQEMLKQMQERNKDQSPASSPPAEKARPVFPAERTPGGRAMPHETARPAHSQEQTTVRSRSLEAKATVPVYAAVLPRASTEAPITDYWEQRERRNQKEHANDAGSSVLNQDIRTLLARPESLRTAFVLSEVLQRRHF